MKAILLSPLSLLFYLIVLIRNKLFDVGFLKQEKFPVRIISVGNLSVGGTGKTPVVANLIDILKSTNKKVGIVSRGYKGTYQGAAEMVRQNKNNADEVYGDEPTWFAKHLDVPVCVGRSRSRAVEKLLSEESVDIIVADDAFQHRWLQRDIDIVLIDMMDKATCILPSGRMREPLRSLKRANYLFFTKCNLVSTADKDKWYKTVEKYGFSTERNNVFEVAYELGRAQLVHGNQEQLKEREKVILATALAQPESFKKMVVNKYEVASHYKNPDHARWSQVDLVSLKNLCRKHHSHHVLMTEKDAVKARELKTKEFNVWSFPLKLTISPEFRNENLVK